MEVVETKEVNNEKRCAKLYKFDNTIQISSIISFIKQFENE